MEKQDLMKRLKECLSQFVNRVDSIQLLPYLPCLSEASKEEITARQDNKGKRQAALELYGHIIRYNKKGIKELLTALRREEIGLEELADLIDPPSTKSNTECKINASSHMQGTDSEKEIKEQSEDKIKMTSFQNSNENRKYESRYLTDFEHVQVLGKGGFGIVYEAKNKYDDCKYAVKRIEISHSETSMEKVMKEVKALAKLDHTCIVRYFAAWIETPPTGWQEGRDREIDSERITGLTPSNSVSELGTKACIHQKKTSPFDNLQNPFGRPNLDFSCSNVERKGANKIFHQGDFTEENEENDSFYQRSSTDQCMAEVEDTNIVEQKVMQRLENSQPKMYVYIQMQLCKRETLKDWLIDNSLNRDKYVVLYIFYQIVSAVKYIHDCHLMHRDLKPSNIFFALDDVVKVGDFGLVTALIENQQNEEEYGNKKNLYKKHTAQVGTHLYMSPEQSTASLYDQKVDIFALGMILFELLCPFSTEMERINTLQGVRCQNFPANFMMPDEKDVVSMLVKKDPEQRPSAKQILDSNFLKQL